MGELLKAGPGGLPISAGLEYRVKVPKPKDGGARHRSGGPAPGGGEEAVKDLHKVKDSS